MSTRTKITWVAILFVTAVSPWYARAQGAKEGQGQGKAALAGQLAFMSGVAMIPREKLLGNPDKASPRISPDGRRLAFLAPVEGVLNVWVGPIDKPTEARPVTHDKVRGIRMYQWAYNNRQIIYLQDAGGNENWHVYAVDLDRGQTTDLTPLENLRANIEEISDRIPDKIVVGLNDRDPEVHDLYQITLASGERRLMQKNTEHFAGFVVDDDYRVRFAQKFDEEGASLLLKPDGKDGWTQFMKIPSEDALTTRPLAFDGGGMVLYMLDSRNRNTGALTAYDLKTDQEKVIAQSKLADISGVLMTPRDHRVLAASYNYERTTWEVLDPAVKADFDTLRQVTHGDVEIVSQSLDDRHWIVAYLLDDGPIRYYHYDRDGQKAHFLFTNRNELETLPLVRMHPVVIKSRDGFSLVSYLSLPRNSAEGDSIRPRQPLAMVLDVHGGPWARDMWGFNPEHQLWANRGYAVLSVNFRGSTGLGKDFANAGNLQWAGKMHDDLVDAVQWVIEQKIADPGRVAITGGSYGGYATLVGLTFTPRSVRLRRGHRRAIEHCHVAEDDPALLEAGDPDVSHSRGRRHDRGRPKVPPRAVSLEPRGPDSPAAADRAGRQRPARQAERVGPGRQGDAEPSYPGDLRAVPRRRTRFRASGESIGLLRGERSLSGRASGADVTSRSAMRFRAPRLRFPRGRIACPVCCLRWRRRAKGSDGGEYLGQRMASVYSRGHRPKDDEVMGTDPGKSADQCRIDGVSAHGPR